MNLDLHPHYLKTASTVHLILSVPRPDGTEVSWSLDVWVGPELMSATGAVYATDATRHIVDRHFERTEAATEATGAAGLVRSMASMVCAERRFLGS